MIRYLSAADINQASTVVRTMFEDRAQQFSRRLNWDVNVDKTGAEFDQYDSFNPLYVVWVNQNGTHGGSMRFLPTTGRTMLAEHFSHLVERPYVDTRIWECTRFCISPGSNSRVSAALLLGGMLLGLHYRWSHSIGVFDARMLRVYKRIGWSPRVIGSDGSDRRSICVGLWRFEPALLPVLTANARIPVEAALKWLEPLTILDAAA
ncbi:MAG: acyl-homoserine-lactone synthase [Paracoccaceae bacterium]|nr:acyl-homoserine-lactone synthase [Paracoccaceae bacterium]